jgi:hypothetical protein
MCLQFADIIWSAPNAYVHSTAPVSLQSTVCNKSGALRKAVAVSYHETRKRGTTLYKGDGVGTVIDSGGHINRKRRG